MTPSSDRHGDGRTVADWGNRLRGGPSDKVFSSAELEGLPEPVRRYLGQRSRRGRRWRYVHGCGCAVASRSAVGCRFRPARCPTRTRVSSGPPVRQESSQAPTGISTGQAPWTGSSRAWSPSRTRMGRRVPERGWPSWRRRDLGADSPAAPFRRDLVAADEAHVTARLHLGPTPVEINLDLDPGGRIRSVLFDRWGDPDQTKSWAWHPFGGEITGYRSFGGLTVPSAGRFG